ncbi:pisatin demethylase cytochrome P450 [Ilyonectria robusta]
MKEAMRIHPAVGFPLERYVPSGGAEICGHKLPAGTNVSISAPVIHLNKDVFGEDAIEFRPERWLEASPEQLRIMDRSFLAAKGISEGVLSFKHGLLYVVPAKFITTRRAAACQPIFRPSRGGVPTHMGTVVVYITGTFVLLTWAVVKANLSLHNPHMNGIFLFAFDTSRWGLYVDILHDWWSIHPQTEMAASVSPGSLRGRYDDDWNAIWWFYDILRHFEKQFKKLEGDNQLRVRRGGKKSRLSGICGVLSSFEDLLHKLEDSKIEAQGRPEPNYYQSCVNAAWDKLDSYWAKITELPIYYAAVVLHPGLGLGYLLSALKDQPTQGLSPSEARAGKKRRNEWAAEAEKMIRDLWGQKYRDRDPDPRWSVLSPVTGQGPYPCGRAARRLVRARDEKSFHSSGALGNFFLSSSSLM